MNREEIYNKIYEDSKKYLSGFSSNIRDYYISIFENHMKNSCDYIIEEINKKLDIPFDEKIKNMSDYDYLNSIADYPSDTISIQNDFKKYGFTISSAQAEYAWEDRSDTAFACWLGIGYNPFIEWFIHCIIGVI